MERRKGVDARDGRGICGPAGLRSDAYLVVFVVMLLISQRQNSLFLFSMTWLP
jgi:hypothetical protein